MNADLQAIGLTGLLAGVTTLVLVLLATPLAWWLANSGSRYRPIVESLVAMPLILPPTVLGFYLLVFLNPESVLGGIWVRVTGQSLTFSFSGLVIASVIYSLPFMVQPLQGAFVPCRSLSGNPPPCWVRHRGTFFSTLWCHSPGGVF